MISKTNIVRVSEEVGSLTGAYLAYREKSGFGGYLIYGLAFFLIGKVAGTLMTKVILRENSTGTQEATKLLVTKNTPIRFERTV